MPKAKTTRGRSWAQVRCTQCRRRITYRDEYQYGCLCGRCAESPAAVSDPEAPTAEEAEVIRRYLGYI